MQTEFVKDGYNDQDWNKKKKFTKPNGIFESSKQNQITVWGYPLTD